MMTYISITLFLEKQSKSSGVLYQPPFGDCEQSTASNEGGGGLQNQQDII